MSFDSSTSKANGSMFLCISLEISLPPLYQKGRCYSELSPDWCTDRKPFQFKFRFSVFLFLSWFRAATCSLCLQLTSLFATPTFCRTGSSLHGRSSHQVFTQIAHCVCVPLNLDCITLYLCSLDVLYIKHRGFRVCPR